MTIADFKALSPPEQLVRLRDAERREPNAGDASVADLIGAFDERLRTLSSREIMELLAHAAGGLATDDEHAYWCCVCELHRRADRSIFETCRTWAASAEAGLRKTSADVLAQLGYAVGRPFALESQTILERLLQESSIGVVRAALVALGHLRVGDLSLIAGCAGHPDAQVREAVVHALLYRDELAARQVLIELSADTAEAVRDWATFGLGTCSRADSPDLRAALVERLDDADDETRGEAIFGLANRKDLRALPAIARELARDEVSGLALEAAAKMPDQRFLPALEALLRSSPEDQDILEAIAACRGQRAP
jgi:hypothetical protein